MAAARPFSSFAALAATADHVWRRLERADILEAFSAHPRIGPAGRAGRAGQAGDAGRTLSGEPTAWSGEEQAGTRTAGGDVLERLAAGNRAYEARFGYIFIICATGQTAAAMLDALETRLHHAPEQELRIAAEEQRRITQLRLAKLVDAPDTP